MTRSVGFLCVLAVLLGISTGMSSQDRAGSPRQPSTATGDWPHYTADVRGTKYSPLDQITAANFGTLEVAWRFKTDSLGPRPEYKLEGTPLAIKGVLYTTGGTRRSVVALDGKTGEVIWTHSLREGRRAAIAPRQLSGRGVSYWTDGKGDDRVPARRARREKRRDDALVRQGRHRRSEGRRRQRQGRADRSGDG
jgi:glucose dehydrogenase